MCRLKLTKNLFYKQITWSFTPRGSDIPIPLSDFTNELKYVNASIDKHDGIYNCSTPSGDYQVKFVILTGFLSLFYIRISNLFRSYLTSPSQVHLA